VLDAALRRVIDPPLERVARPVAAIGVRANAITLTGFAFGLLAVPLIAAEWYAGGLAAIFLNRLADGLDGAVARIHGASDLGGFLDIACDFIFYAGVAFGFALARPENTAPAAFLLFAFIGTGATFLAYAVMAAKRGHVSQRHGSKSLYYLGGLTEGTETIVAFVVFCLFPNAFPILAVVFGALCWVTTGSRLVAAFTTLSD
jgi:phosphatidylglycerophosphate synthase